MPPRSERLGNLREYINQELEAFKAGKKGEFPSYRELAEQFGYATESGTALTIKRMGLQEDVRQVKKESDIFSPSKRTRRTKRHRISEEYGVKPIYPSTNWARIIGVLAAGGYVAPADKRISLDSVDKDFLANFKTEGERLFEINASDRIKNNTLQGIAFYSINIARQVGDLRRPQWPTTILEKHSWILKEQRYTWTFLTGFFDARGSIYKRSIILRNAYINSANFIAELLIRVGIKDPSLISNKEKRAGIDGIGIFNLRDLITFSKHVYSADPLKEEKLKFFREQKFSRMRTKTIGNDELIFEWKRIYKLLGHIPRTTEIDMLKREGKTGWSSGIYVYRFGRLEEEKQGKWSVALRNLLRICFPNQEPEELLDTKHRFQKYKRNISREQLIESYRIAREKCLTEEGRLPSIPYINLLKRKGLIAITGQTIANYFGNRSYPNARENLERIIAEREAEKSKNDSSGSQETQIFP